MKKNILVAILAMLMPVLALAQNNLSGTVTDAASRAPLAGAIVSLSNGTAVSTAPDGTYRFRNLKNGKYTISVRYLGYSSQQRSIDIPAGSDVDFSLNVSAYMADEVVVSATRASENAATTYQNISKEEIEKNNSGRDLPYLLNLTPGVVVTSDAGAGIGYTGIRIRGTDPTRINVTINGIPYNESESQGTFWVNMPDFASSVENMQVQRGVGTSTNGAGAFGGSLNIQTGALNEKAYAELDNTYGSFNTWKNTVRLGSGLIANQFSFDGRLSNIRSEGYIDRGSSRLKSYFLSGAWYGKNTLLRANVFSGTEKTYQAWNGVPENKLDTDRTYNVFTYNDQTDNYTQDHYQLLLGHSFSDKVSVNAALHYTYGRGYYEEFKEDDALAKYGIPDAVIGGTTISSSDLVRRRWLDNDFYGATWSLNYTPKDRLKLTLGGGYNEYDGDHFGQVIRGEYVPVGADLQRYYNGNGFKTDFNIYGKAEYGLGAVNLFADLQYRGLDYTISGTDKNRNTLDIHDRLSFFNPKLGISYIINPANSVYASFAVANKEPNRDDYVNSTPATRPKAENLKNIEAGYRFTISSWKGGINGYAMFYKDQLILNGKINDVGEYIRQNVADSYRIGLELDSRLNLAPNLAWNATAALSRNRVKDFVEYIDDYDNGGQVSNHYDETDIAFSPSFVGSSELAWTVGKTELAFMSKYISRQYLDNTSNEARSIDPFFVNDVRIRYNIPFRGLKNLGLSLLVNNVFGEVYETNGYTFSYVAGGDQTTENYYFPQAKQNFLLSLNVKF